MAARTPLAWKNLTSDWRRMLLASAGVAFAAVLMFMQNGFRNALLDSPVQLVRMIECDLIAVSPARYALPTDQTFPASLLDRALSSPDIESVAPLWMEATVSYVRIAHLPRRPIRVLGLPDQPGWFNDPRLASQYELIRLPSAALLDDRSRREYGFDLNDPESLRGQVIELANQSLRVVGTVSIGSDFANEGTLLMNQQNFSRYFPFRGNGDPLSVVDLGLIRLRSGADPQAAAAALNRLDPAAWVVMTKDELIQREIDFWNRQTPVGMIFAIGALMGFAVGVIICYQILFTSIHDAMPEYATLKAMGYPNRFFVGLVVRQSIYLSIIGFFPALAISWGLFHLLEWLAGLPMMLTFWRASLVLGLTTLMCLISGLLALRKLLHADPASLF